MGKFAGTFKKIASAKPVTGFASQIPLGRHRLALTGFTVKETQKEKYALVESTWRVLETTSDKVKPGQTRNYAWHIGATGFRGEYDSGRNQVFLEIVKESLGLSEPIDEVGEYLADDGQPLTGLVLDCEVLEQLDRDGEPKKGKRGQVYTETVWAAVEQSDEDVAAMAVELGKTPEVASDPEPREPARAPAKAPDPEPTSAPSTGAAPSRLAALRGKRA